MQRTAEDMNDDQDSESQAPDSESQGDASNAFAPEPTEDTKAFNISRNASEAAGETIAVVGESTGRFPRTGSVESGEREGTGKHAFMVGAGILISRVVGVVRQRVFAYYFGNSLAADAFTADFCFHIRRRSFGISRSSPP